MTTNQNKQKENQINKHKTPTNPNKPISSIYYEGFMT